MNYTESSKSLTYEKDYATQYQNYKLTNKYNNNNN